MTNINALKNVYISLGGELTDTYDDIANGTPVGDMVLLADVIEAVSRKSGSGLPKVTDADDGKVLGVENGEWAPVEAGGGEETVIYDVSLEITLATDKQTINGITFYTPMGGSYDFSTITAEIAAGKKVALRIMGLNVTSYGWNGGGTVEAQVNIDRSQTPLLSGTFVAFVQGSTGTHMVALYLTNSTNFGTGRSITVQVPNASDYKVIF